MTPSLHGRNLFRTGALAAVILASAAYADILDIPVSPELDGNSTNPNWLSFSAAGYIGIDGSEAYYQRRHQHESAGLAGVDSFRLDKTVFGDLSLRVDGKAIVGDNEYFLRAVLKDEANGWYLDAGFKESTVFYAGTGGYSPGGLWIQPFDDQLDLYRGRVWLEAGLNKEAWTFKVRGSHEYRKGSKDSTMWGDSIYSGLGTTARKTVPALMDIDETRNTLEIDLGYEGENFDAGAGARFENIETENQTTILRNPGQANPSGSGERYQMTIQGTDADLFAGHAYVVTRIGDRLTLSGAGSTTTMDTVLSGDRWFAAVPTAPYNPSFPRTSTGHGYNDLHGDTQWDQWVLVGNAVFVPGKNWTINGGLRYENQTQDSFSEYIETAGPATAPFEEPFEQEGEREFDEILATLEANYTGLANWVFTPFVEYATGEGTLIEEQLEGHAPSSVVVIDRDTEYDRDYVKYGINGRWYPTSWFNGALGAYSKERNNLYTTVADNTPPTGGNRYPAFIADQDFTTDDLYVRGTLRPSSSFTITARYDWSETEIESTEMGLNAVIAAEQRAEIASATVTWSATSNFALQAGVNLVKDDMETGTVYARAPVASTIGDFSSDYTTYTVLAMLALDETADLQIDYNSFSSDNYRNVYTYTLPYGLEADEEIIGATYTKRLSADMIFSFRVVLSHYTDKTSGGNLDYDSQMVYGRLQMRF